jgi:hypothetical protein
MSKHIFFISVDKVKILSQTNSNSNLTILHLLKANFWGEIALETLLTFWGNI